MSQEIPFHSQKQAGGNPEMPPTLWNLVFTAGEGRSPESLEALGKLCEAYWYPLYSFVRRRGNDHHRAQDLTQGFFESLLRQDWLKNVGPERGRFRTFLLCSITHFLSNEHEKEQAIKRGGQQQFVSWDAEEAENRYASEPITDADETLEYERKWACLMVERATRSLEDEYRRCGKALLFQLLFPYVARPVPIGFYAEATGRFNMSESALKVALHRLIPRFGQVLRSEVARTVSNIEMVDEELREIVKAWARS